MSNEYLDLAGLTEYDTKLKSHIEGNFVSKTLDNVSIGNGSVSYGKSIAIGKNSSAGNSSFSKNICIGNGASANSGDSICIGNIDISNSYNVVLIGNTQYFDDKPYTIFNDSVLIGNNPQNIDKLSTTQFICVGDNECGYSTATGANANVSVGSRNYCVNKSNKKFSEGNAIVGCGNEYISSRSSIIGYRNTIYSKYGIVIGSNNYIVPNQMDENTNNIHDCTSTGNIILGDGSYIYSKSAKENLLVGRYNTLGIEGNDSEISNTVCVGRSLTMRTLRNDSSNYLVLLGGYNDRTLDYSNHYLAVGGGVSNSTRKNVFELKKNESGTTSMVLDDIEVSSDKLSILNISPEMHRNIYRGKNLGTSVTTAQLDAISNGTFDDIYVGDYWVINGTTYVIVDIDYYYGIGDISKMSKHHVVIVPKNISTFAAMNTTASYKPYYYARNAISELTTLRNTIKTDFGSTNVLTYENRFLDSNGTDGTPNSSATARDASIELMNEIQIFGLNIVSPQKINSIKFYDNRQFAGFKLNHSLYLPNISTTDYTGYWTRDYANSSSYSAVINYGHVEEWTANLQLGLRPYFLLGK